MVDAERYVEDEKLNQEIIEGMKKDNVVKGDHLEDTSDIEESLLRSEWVMEANQIPLELVSNEEEYYLRKCINKELFTPDEQKELQKILDKYRGAIRKIEPDKTLENLENSMELIEDEHEFLNLVDTFNEVQVIPFTFYIGAKQIRLKFDLYPLTDGRAIDSITENIGLFENLTQKEQAVYTKNQNGEPLTPEEKIIQQGLQKRINEATTRNTREIVIEYLALQLKFHNRKSTVEDMRKVFNKIDINYLSLLFEEVQKRNHISDIKTENVFQEFS